MPSMNRSEPESLFRPLPLEVRHLRLVVAVVEEGGLTRAGERLNLTQSALSHQLKQIETSLGVSLFTRVKMRLVLTESGAELVERARGILSDISDLESDLRERATGRRGSLRLATQCYTCYEWLPPLLKRFYRLYPNVDVQIVADATSDPVEALREGRIDLAILSSRADEAAFESIELFSDEMLLLVSPDHPLASKPYVTPSDFKDQTLLSYSPPSDSYFYQMYLAHSPQAPQTVTVIKLTEAILSMVRAGLGVNVAARWAVADDLREGRIAGVRIGSKGFFRTWYAALRRTPRRERPPYVGAFLDLIGSASAPVRFAERQAR
jgi:LysR family transcriptional regulator for metE and metH